MALSGKYELVRNEGFLEHLIADGVPEEQAKKVAEGSKTLEISINGDNVSLTRASGPAQKLKLNQETSESGPDGKVHKSTASLNGDALTVVTDFGEKGVWKRVYSISGDELTSTSVASKAGVPDGKRIYKRV